MIRRGMRHGTEPADWSDEATFSYPSSGMHNPSPYGLDCTVTPQIGNG